MLRSLSGRVQIAAQRLKETTNNQSKIRTDHEYQNMLRRVVDEVFPE